MLSGIYLCCCLLFTSSLGFKSFQRKIPNGDSVPHPCKPNYLWHGVGHRNELGGGSRNPFGEDFDAAGKTWTRELCMKDSDGDSKTNGEELGDPDCVWTENAIPNKNAFSHPGVCEPFDSDLCRSKNAWVQCELDEFKCDSINDPDVKNVTLRFPETNVPNLETNYFCMTFELPQDGDYHMIATQPYIDNEYIMHHIILYGCDDTVNETETTPSRCQMASVKCGTIIATWAVGGTGECAHKDVGFRIGQQGFKYAMMQFHWNNYERRSDYKDSSGLTLFYTPNRRPNDAVMMAVGQNYLEIPPRQDHVEVQSVCTGEDTKLALSGPVYITRAFNHMHYLGRGEFITQYRNGVKVHTITDEPDYSYDRPRFLEYNTAIQVLPGDEIRTKCVFKSTSKSTTTFKGDATSDEMCFGFLTIHPISNVRHTLCTTWKNVSELQLYNGYSECKYEEYFNPYHPRMSKLYENVDSRCLPLSKCLEECKEAVKEFKQHPCMKGDMHGLTKMYATLGKTFESFEFYSKLESCDLEILREEMEAQRERESSGGSRVVPPFLTLFSLFVLLI